VVVHYGDSLVGILFSLFCFSSLQLTAFMVPRHCSRPVPGSLISAAAPDEWMSTGVAF
jgi:hypothetical protein